MTAHQHRRRDDNNVADPFEDRLRAGLDALAQQGPAGPTPDAVRAVIQGRRAPTHVRRHRLEQALHRGEAAALAASVLAVLGLSFAIALLGPSRQSTPYLAGELRSVEHAAQRREFGPVESERTPRSGRTQDTVERTEAFEGNEARPAGKPLPADTPWPDVQMRILAWLAENEIERLGVRTAPDDELLLVYTRRKDAMVRQSTKSNEILVSLLSAFDFVRLEYDGEKLRGSVLRY